MPTTDTYKVPVHIKKSHIIDFFYYNFFLKYILPVFDMVTNIHKSSLS